jgi:outer membrane protein
MLNKAVKSAAMVLLGSFMLLGNASAKDMKIGIVDYQAIAQQLPQMASIQQTIQDEFKEKLEAIKKLEADIKYNMDKLQREGSTLSTAQQDELKKTILGQRKTFEAQGQPLQREMQRRGSEEQNKVMTLVQQSVEKVAKDGDYDFILRKESLAYSKDAAKSDISTKVAEQVKNLK